MAQPATFILNFVASTASSPLPARKPLSQRAFAAFLLKPNGVSRGFATKYWTPEVQDAAFALPRFIAEIAAKAKA